MAQLQDPSASNVVQAHSLLPPPPPRHQTAPSVCPLAFRKVEAVDHVLCDSLHPHINIVLIGVHPTLLQYFIQGWEDPLMLRPPSRYVLPCHPICRTEVKSLKPCQSGHAQNPDLTAVYEDGLYDCIVQLVAYFWGCILPLQHLSDPCPCPACLAKLALHDLDVNVILREQAAKVPEYLDSL